MLNPIRSIVHLLLASQLRRNMTSGLAVSGINFLITAVSYPIYLHYLGYEKYGLWLVLTTVLGFAQLGNLGINVAVSRFVANHFGHGDFRSIDRDVTTALFILTVSGGAILAAILLFRYEIISAFKLDPENADLVIYLLPYVGSLSLYVFIVRVTAATLTGLGRIDLVNYVWSGSRIVSITIAVILLYHRFGMKSLLISYFVSELFAHTFFLFLIKRFVRIHYFRVTNVNKQSFRRLVTFGGGLLGGTLLNMLMGPFNKFIISRFLGVQFIPIYEIAFNASMYIQGLLTTSFRALIPEISQLFGSADSAVNRIRYIYTKTMKMTLSFGTPLFLLIFLIAPILLKIWLREDFDALLPPIFRIMLVSTFFSLLGSTPYFYLIGLGRVKYVFTASAIQTGVDITYLIVLIALGIKVTTLSVATAVLLARTTSSLYVLYQNNRVLSAIEGGQK